MLHKTSLAMVIVSMVSVFFISGCGPSASLNLKFTPEDTTSYKATTEVIKDYRFEQPTMGKLTEQQTKNLVIMEYSQTVQDVDEGGNATVKITIDELKIEFINKNETTLAFDSRNEKDKKAPMAKLLGQSYTIKITPSGKVELLDAKEAMAAVQTQYEKKITKSILDPQAVAKRHEIPALPQDRAGEVSIEDSWSEVVASPPGLLAPKSYEKVYTLTAIENNIGSVNMVASESAKAADVDSPSDAGMGMFAKMFDNVDDYTGSMKIDLATGQVLNSQETLISSYVAQEMPENGDPEKGPDTLTMRFTNRVKLEKLN